MDELFRILISKTINLEHLGFCEVSVNPPKGSSFGMSWRHDALNLNFNITWDRMEMLIVSCNVGSKNEFNWFYKTLEYQNIDYDLNSLSYKFLRGKQFDTGQFTKVLDYNLQKLGQLVMVLK